MKRRSNTAEDLALVALVRDRDPQAVDAFVERMRCVPRFVHRKNLQYGRPIDDWELEDISQSILISIWRKLGDYGGLAPLEAWAYRFVHLEMMYCLRRKDRLPTLLPELERTPDREQHSGPKPDEREAVYRALERVGSPEADVIRMKHLEELTFREIAERTGVELNTLKTQYYRGLVKVRRSLGALSESVGGCEP